MQAGPVNSNTLRRGGGASLTTRGTSPMRCTLPMTAFLVTPMRRPISAVVTPSSHSSTRRAIRSGVQVGSTTHTGASSSSLGSSVQVPSILFPRILWLDPYPPQDKVSLLWVGANRYLHLVASRGKTATPIRYHLGKVREGAFLRGKTRLHQPVEIL